MLKERQYVLFAPIRRGASHLLRFILMQGTSNSRALFAPYPPHIYDFLPQVSTHGDLENDDNWFALIANVIHFFGFSVDPWPNNFDPFQVFEELLFSQRSVHQVVKCLFENAAPEEADVILDKSLDSILEWEELIQVVPNLKVVNLVRKPDQLISSMTLAPIYNYSPGLNAQRYVQAQEAMQGFSQSHPASVFTISYEQMIAALRSRDVTVFFELMNFLGLPEPDATERRKMFYPHLHPEAQRLAPRSKLWRSNNKSADPTRNKKELSPRDLLLIESMTKPYYELYNYPLTTAADMGQEEIAAIIAEEVAVEEVKRHAAMEVLRGEDFRDFHMRNLRRKFVDQLTRF